jgi:ring-1,2-phenylacetyl-CoA epoxidase subunit PaaD
VSALVDEVLDPAPPPTRPAAAVLDGVHDPEIPVLTIADLGILRSVSVDDIGRVEVVVTPTYSGCPAMDAIRTDIVAALTAAGYPDVRVRTVLAPAWTTDWITERGRARLAAFGIAPPAPVDGRAATGPVSLALRVRRPAVACPQCGSTDTVEVSRFSSTACKAAFSCRSCREPFDSFKAL